MIVIHFFTGTDKYTRWGATFKNLGNAMNLKFDETQLNEYYDCETVCDHSTSRFKDRFSDDCGYIAYKNNVLENECVTDLMVYIKYYVERKFKETIDLLNEACPSQKRNRPQTPTGNYYWNFVQYFY